jgi:hypothetical protein
MNRSMPAGARRDNSCREPSITLAGITAFNGSFFS